MGSSSYLAAGPFYLLESSTQAGPSPGPHSGVHSVVSTYQHLELGKSAKKLGSIILEAKLGQTRGSFTGSKVDGHKGSPGSEEEPDAPITTAAQYLLDGLSPKHYYLLCPGLPGTELGASCSLFNYLVA